MDVSDTISHSKEDGECIGINWGRVGWESPLWNYSLWSSEIAVVENFELNFKHFFFTVAQMVMDDCKLAF